MSNDVKFLKELRNDLHQIGAEYRACDLDSVIEEFEELQRIAAHRPVRRERRRQLLRRERSTDQRDRGHESMSELKEIAAKAADLLPKAFAWSDTPQGHNYWAQVYLDLHKLAEAEIKKGWYRLDAEMDAYPRGEAPLANETDRKNALELADLIDEILLLCYLTPILTDNDPFVRWATVQEDLLELGGEYLNDEDDYFDELENG